MLICPRDDRRSASAVHCFAQWFRWILTVVLGCALAGAAADTPPPETPPAEPRTTTLQEKNPMHKPLPTAAEIAKLPVDGGPEFNRLIFEKSPYLLQHARNPVDWYPWGSAAFEKAKKENKPIFLSVGYSTCHWCHVMERESFESEAIAQILNERYVAIKVDREERPDLDDIYMNATQLMTQRGGWPNSLWLRPDATPWFAGTYFPPDDRYGRPGFAAVLTKLSEVWQQQREKVDEQAEMLAAEMKRLGGGAQVDADGALSRQVVADALQKLPKTFDRFKGGFGTAPKFPPHGSLALMLYELRPDAAHPPADRAALVDMTRRTLDAMALGGIHDHIGGGFHRYSTDADWFLPHFEKMLYDNAQLAAVYTQAFAVTRDPHDAAVARDICDWVLRDMTDAGGGFYSALDADSEGEEGKFYLWTPAEVAAVLGATDAALFCRVYNVEKDGNYHEEATGHETGASIAHLKRSLTDNAKIEAEPLEAFTAKLAALREKLRVAREKRVHPHLDDKILTSWNGLMIGALAQAGTALQEPRYTAAAEKAAQFLLTTMYKHGRLLRTARGGEAKLDGYLEDYAFLGNGLLDLYAATGKTEYRDRARELSAAMVEHFYDPEAGGFYFTANDHEKLLLRQKDAFDQAIPAGNGMAVQLLTRLAVLPDTPAATAKIERTQARATLTIFLGLMQKMPRGTESLLLGAARIFDAAPTGAAAEADSAATAVLDKPDAQAAAGEISAAAYLSHTQAAPGDSIRIAVQLTVQPGFHLYDVKPQAASVLPTVVKLAETTALPPPAGSPPNTKPTQVRIQQPVKITATDAPAAKTAELAGDKVNVYDGTITVILTCQLNTDLQPGHETISLQIQAQPCSNTECKLPVDLRLLVPVEIVKSTPLAVMTAAPRHAEKFKR